MSRPTALGSFSMPALVLLGFSMVALPLIAFIITAGIYVDRLEKESERLVAQGILVTRISDKLTENIERMERAAGQYQATGDPSLIQFVAGRQAEFAASLDQLQSMPTGKMAGWNLDLMHKESETVLNAMRQYPSGSPELASALGLFRNMHSMAAMITTEGNRFIDSELDSLQATARGAKRFMILPSVVLIPSALLLVLIFTYLIVRPIRNLADAIHLIGVGKFERPIDIGGPPELEALGRKLDWLRTRLAGVEEEKNTFLRRMSHELKTPLASLREGSDLLLDGTVGTLTPQQREVAAILQGTGIELQYLIENLLDFSEWNEKKAEIKPENCDLGAVINYVMRRHQLAIANKQLEVITELEDIQLLADRNRIRVALDNLISNAVKFTPPGGKVYIKTRNLNSEVTVEVADTGPGILPSERQKIFEAFYQGSAPQLGHVRGTGIGLSVVSECVKAHGGSIEIVDGEYSGAHFRIRLPMGRTRR